MNFVYSSSPKFLFLFLFLYIFSSTFLVYTLYWQIGNKFFLFFFIFFLTRGVFLVHLLLDNKSVKIQSYSLLIELIKSMNLSIYKYLIRITNKLNLVAYLINSSRCDMGYY